jgi:hypothetical protein
MKLMDILIDNLPFLSTRKDRTDSKKRAFATLKFYLVNNEEEEKL